MLPILPRLLPLLKDHWRPFAVTLLLLLAFACGRFAAPTRVEYRTTETRVTAEKHEERKAEVKAEVKERIVYRDRSVVTYRDGRVEHRDIVKTDVSAKVAAIKTDDSKTESVTAQTKTTAKVITRDAPRLHVNALAAMDLAHLAHLARNLAFGAQVEYRIAGPLTVGAFGLSSGVFGVSVGIAF